jgi:hypothetical protein
LSRRLRFVGASVLALLLQAWPMGDAGILLALVLVIDAAVLLLLLPEAPKPAAAILEEPEAEVVLSSDSDGGSMRLLRRTIPALRMRRPSGVIEAQIRWRQTGEAHRRSRQIDPVVRLPR